MRWYATLFVPVALFVAASAFPDAPALTVTLRCPAKVAAGRVRCDVEAVPSRGSTLSWADVVILPGSLAPLRGRLAPADGEVRPERAAFGFALLATDHGPAEVRVAVRAVVCGDAGCNATSVERRIDVVVE
ncbi:hypothetical protein BH09MYX1_BH09MYX1_31150 [soil metagenome]